MRKKKHILIVDDDREFAENLVDHMDDLGRVEIAISSARFHELFVPYKYDLVLLDLRLEKAKEGLELLDRIVEEDPSLAVIVVSGYGDISTAVDTMRKGAKTFVEKDKLSYQEIRLVAEHTLAESFAQRRIQQLEACMGEEDFVGEDDKISKIRKMVELVSQDGETTILVRGETGTGKELIARAIHKRGVRKEGPFVSVALVDVNSETFTSELFGHEKGAFTGATRRHHGFFECAHQGILFLDEIGELPLDIQVKLLRVLDNKTFRRMGGDKDISTDVQVVTATNRPLEKMVQEGSFREDLYYRLRVFEIQMPPLRDRKGDIPLLAEYFLRNLGKRGRTSARKFTPEALELMLSHAWPGNVRELKASVESGALRCRLEGGKKITRKHLAPALIKDNEIPSETGEDINKRLARVELEIVEAALRSAGGKKTVAYKHAGYSNRFLMTRRVNRIIREYPDLHEKYHIIKENYTIREHGSAEATTVD